MKKIQNVYGCDIRYTLCNLMLASLSLEFYIGYLAMIIMHLQLPGMT